MVFMARDNIDNDKNVYHELLRLMWYIEQNGHLYHPQWISIGNHMVDEKLLFNDINARLNELFDQNVFVNYLGNMGYVHDLFPFYPELVITITLQRFYSPQYKLQFRTTVKVESVSSPLLTVTTPVHFGTFYSDNTWRFPELSAIDAALRCRFNMTDPADKTAWMYNEELSSLDSIGDYYKSRTGTQVTML